MENDSKIQDNICYLDLPKYNGRLWETPTSYYPCQQPTTNQPDNAVNLITDDVYNYGVQKRFGKYDYMIEEYSIEADKLDSFMTKFRAVYPNATIHRVKLSKTKFDCQISNIQLECNKHLTPSSYLEPLIMLNNSLLGSTYKISIIVNTVLEAEELSHFIESISIADDTRLPIIQIEDLSLRPDGGLSTSTQYIKLTELSDTNKMYYPYLDLDILFNKYLVSNDSILVLTGMPGVGKSKLIRIMLQFMLNNHEEYFPGERLINATYVKNEDVLSKDQFWSHLKGADSGDSSITNFVFLDDLDYALLPRTQEVSSDLDVNKNKFISQLLSYTDGIHSNSNTKFIITTNKPVSHIDTAILRKGRTFDILNLRELSKDEARQIWDYEESELGEGISFNIKFDDMFKEETVLQADLGSTIEFEKNAANFYKKFGANDKYVLEDGISFVRYSSKKIGLI